MHLVFDFDGTIAAHDTLNAFVRGVSKHQVNNRGVEEDPWPQWEEIERLYFAAFEAHKASYTPSAAERRSLDEERQFLASMGTVEEASIQRVHQLGVFQGLDKETLRKVGQEAVRNGDVVVRAGFWDLLALAESRGWDVSVLSINWSRTFIDGVLDGKISHIIANEINSDDGTIGGPAEGFPRMTCAGDKLAALKGLVLVGDKDETETGVVYFGDSTTDLECLLVGKGVVMASDEDASSLLKTLGRIGWNVQHASAVGRDAARLCWAADFAEILSGNVLG